jgi:hypothetical protein
MLPSPVMAERIMAGSQRRRSSKNMSKKKNEIITQSEAYLDESLIYNHVSNIIETRKVAAGSYANREATLMYWEVGQYINTILLKDGRAGYGKKILPTLSAKLSWSHIIELLPLKTKEEQLFYAEDVAQRNLGVRELRRQISRKAFERREIANTGLSLESSIPFNTFKDLTQCRSLGQTEYQVAH